MYEAAVLLILHIIIRSRSTVPHLILAFHSKRNVLHRVMMSSSCHLPSSKIACVTTTQAVMKRCTKYDVDSSSSDVVIHWTMTGTHVVPDRQQYDDHTPTTSCKTPTPYASRRYDTWCKYFVLNRSFNKYSSISSTPSVRADYSSLGDTSSMIT